MALFIFSIFIMLFGFGATGMTIYLLLEDIRYYESVGRDRPTSDSIEAQTRMIVFCIGVLGLVGCFKNWPW